MLIELATINTRKLYRSCLLTNLSSRTNLILESKVFIINGSKAVFMSSDPDLTVSHEGINTALDPLTINNKNFAL